MIEIRFQGGYGDWLWQYAFGRVLGEKWEMKLRAPAVPGMPDAKSVSDGREIVGPMEVFAGSSCELLFSGSLLRPRQLSRRMDARVVLSGWFQRFEYVAEFQSSLYAWFHQDVEQRDRDTMAICLRERSPDAWSLPGSHAGIAGPWPGSCPDPEAIRNVLRRVQPMHVEVFAETAPGAKVAELLAPWGYSGAWTRLDTPAAFRRLRTFGHICGSEHHSFEWWAAFLNPSAHAWLHDPYRGGASVSGHPCTGECGLEAARWAARI